MNELTQTRRAVEAKMAGTEGQGDGWGDSELATFTFWFPDAGILSVGDTTK